MALRESSLFSSTTCTLSGLSIASFAFAIVTCVMSGKGMEIDRGGTGLLIPNVAALVAIIAIALTLLFGACLGAWRRWRAVAPRAYGRPPTRPPPPAQPPAAASIEHP